MSQAVKKSDQVVYALAYAYHLIGRTIPLKAWLRFGRRLGAWAYQLDNYHRGIVCKNMRLAYGDEKDDQTIQKMARQNFEQFGMIAQELALLKQRPQWLVKHLDRFVQVEGQAYLEAAKKKSRAVILLGAHFGNWEFAHLYYARHFNRLNFIVRRIDNPLLEQGRRAYNADFGVNILYKERGLRDAIKKIRSGEDLVIFADQKANIKEGIPCRFFGHRTSTLSIAPALAQKYRIPLVPMFMVRDRDSRRHRILFLPEVPIEYGRTHSDLTSLSQRQNDLIESVIRRHPDHWLWLHRKWKTEYPEMYR